MALATLGIVLENYGMAPVVSGKSRLTHYTYIAYPLLPYYHYLTEIMFIYSLSVGKYEKNPALR
jgi:hypothetical protein